VDRGTGGLLLTSIASTRRARAGEYVVILVAIAGAWLFWSEYGQLATLSWWYDRAAFAQTTAALPNPDYDLDSLPWQVATPHLFERHPGRAVLVTDGQPYAYQAFATLNTNRAAAADYQFDVDVESGGVTIGLLQGGTWIATSSSARAGAFTGSNSTLLGYSRSLTFVIANNNPAGESRAVVKSLRLYLRR